MARKCRHKACRSELPAVKQCDSQYQRKGFCGVSCVANHARLKNEQRRARERRKEQKQARERIKTKAQWRSEAQAAVNKYIRERDRGKPCISCDKPDDGSHQRHASHYRSVKACSALRYNTRNIYASCAQCNAIESGNLLEYRIRLIRRFGPDLVDWLESQNQTARYEIEYLRRLKAVFNKRSRHIMRLRGTL